MEYLMKKCFALLAGSFLVAMLFANLPAAPLVDGIRVFSAGLPLESQQEAVLFAFDDHSLPFRKNLFLTLQPAQKHQNPILKRGGPGDPDEARAQFHGTVLHVNGKFRMWYVAIDEPSVQEFHKARGMAGLQSRVALAESSDGVHWVKPNLGLVEYRGSKANNLVDMEPGVLWPSILYEPGDPDPAKRYKMVFKATGGRLKGLLDRYSGFDYLVSPLCAYSPDGLHWRLAPQNPPLKGNMEGTNFYKFGGSYFMQGHIYSAWSPTTGLLLNGDPTGRVLFTYRSPDFIRWSEAPALSFARQPPCQPPHPHRPQAGSARLPPLWAALVRAFGLRR